MDLSFDSFLDSPCFLEAGVSLLEKQDRSLKGFVNCKDVGTASGMGCLEIVADSCLKAIEVFIDAIALVVVVDAPPWKWVASAVVFSSKWNDPSLKGVVVMGDSSVDPYQEESIGSGRPPLKVESFPFASVMNSSVRELIWDEQTCSPLGVTGGGRGAAELFLIELEPILLVLSGRAMSVVDEGTLKTT